VILVPKALSDLKESKATRASKGQLVPRVILVILARRVLLGPLLLCMIRAMRLLGLW
jgi:hypothetical protein